MIVTYNVRDFPGRPSRRGATAAARSLVAVKRRPPRTMEEEIEGPRAYMLGRFAEFIEQTLGLG